MQLTVHLEPAEEGGFTATLKEFPEVISEGDDHEQALANLMDALATYLAWKSTRELQAGRARPVRQNAFELEIA
jgi:predicted RNase H-like HicB family nuclease